MISMEELREFLLVSLALSTITCAFVQKTKVLWKTKNYLVLYSLIVNILFSIIFCMSFTTISFPMSLWTGLFSFLGADTIYRSLEGKISTYDELRKARSFKKENIIKKWNQEEK
ncbi:MAG: hypothetical protein IJ193_06495 [Bacilli bacterium]|nr:hypothetical protein [Bacilli bacterium]